MRFLQRLGLGLATSIFSLLLFVLAVSVSTYMVLDKPTTIKKALSESGAYQVLVDNTLAQKQQQLSVYLPVENTEVQQAIRAAFPTTYLQSTAEHNIDVTYDWLHGLTQKPNYSADLDQPKAALAKNIGQLVEQKLAGLPACTSQTVVPTTVADVLSLNCRPVGIPTPYLVAAAEQGVGQSNVFNQVVAPVLTLQDEQGRSLTDSLSIVPKVYNYFIISLYVVPVVLALCGLAILFWSSSRRGGARVMGRSLLTAGIMVILFSLIIVWALGKGAQWSAGSNNDLILIEGKIVEVAHYIGERLRTWLVGIGAGYVILGIILLILAKVWGHKNAKQNVALNSSLGYNSNIPKAGTMFDPEATRQAGAKASTPTEHTSDPDFTFSKRPNNGQKTKNNPQ